MFSRSTTTTSTAGVNFKKINVPVSRECLACCLEDGRYVKDFRVGYIIGRNVWIEWPLVIILSLLLEEEHKWWKEFLSSRMFRGGGVFFAHMSCSADKFVGVGGKHGSTWENLSVSLSLSFCLHRVTWTHKKPGRDHQQCACTDRPSTKGSTNFLWGKPQMRLHNCVVGFKSQND